MNMSLNLPQPRRPRTLRPNIQDEVLAFIEDQFRVTGIVPSRHEVAEVVRFNYQSICKIIARLQDQGRLSPAILEARERQRERRPKPATCHLHSGDCTPETADRLVSLIKNDIEARIAFFELLRGNIRKDPT